MDTNNKTMEAMKILNASDGKSHSEQLEAMQEALKIFSSGELSDNDKEFVSHAKAMVEMLEKRMINSGRLDNCHILKNTDTFKICFTKDRELIADIEADAAGIVFIFCKLLIKIPSLKTLLKDAIEITGEIEKNS